jgi:predicted CXXCH cytochrome family protein
MKAMKKKIATTPSQGACCMDKHEARHFLALILITAWLVTVASLFGVATARAQETSEYCLSCHGKPEASMTLPSGETLSLYISPEMLQSSAHAKVGIECRACHANIQTYPHPKIEYENKRELSRAYYLVCKDCHSANYEKTLDSIHARAAEQGNVNAPICTDCHGAHDVKKPDSPRSLISTTCGQCHTNIYAEYKDSVHGGALIQEDNPDVPVCTDCHGVHNIHDPRTEQFRIAQPDLCAGCHANAELMSKYNLPANVYNLYRLSWHGVDVSVYKARWPTIWHDSAVCSDCHGVHNIRKTEDPASMVSSQNLLGTCQKCHPKAGPNWVGAWTGHHEISLSRTPFLFYTQAFYTSFTPFVLWLSIIYIVLQIVRSTVDRVRGSLSK